jgi:hypothetical protein
MRVPRRLIKIIRRRNINNNNNNKRNKTKVVERLERYLYLYQVLYHLLQLE